MWRRKKEKERREIFVEGKHIFLRRRRKAEKGKRENIFFCGGKGEEENIWRRNIYFCGREEKNKKKEKEKNKIFWRRTMSQ